MLLPRSLGIGGNQLGKLHPEVSVFQKANSFSAGMGKWDAFSPQLVWSTGDSQFFHLHFMYRLILSHFEKGAQLALVPGQFFMRGISFQPLQEARRS